MLKTFIRVLYLCFILALGLLTFKLYDIRVDSIRAKCERAADEDVQAVLEACEEPKYIEVKDGEFVWKGYHKSPYLDWMDAEMWTDPEAWEDIDEWDESWHCEIRKEEVDGKLRMTRWMDFAKGIFPEDKNPRKLPNGDIERDDGTIIPASAFTIDERGFYLVEILTEEELNFRETVYQKLPVCVLIDINGSVLVTSTGHDQLLEYQEVSQMIKNAMKEGKESGWYGKYRYRIYTRECGKVAMFDKNANVKELLDADIRTQKVSAIVQFIVITVLVTFMFVLFEIPVNRSIKKQRQFVAHAGNDLRVPLSSIQTNISKLAKALGPCEWVDDMRIESDNMSVLIDNLVEMGKLDAAEKAAQATTGNRTAQTALTTCVQEVVSSYEHAAESRGLLLDKTFDEDVICRGNEENIRRVLGALMDNALKYCDPNGTIEVTLTDPHKGHGKTDEPETRKSRRHGKRIELTITNDCAKVDEIKLDKLFERFYRADQARTAGSGFGIGLSMSKSICAQEGAKIAAYKADDKRIGFRVLFSNRKEGKQ